MRLFKDSEIRYATEGTAYSLNTLIEGSASTVDTNIKRVILLNRHTMEILGTTVVRSDNTWSIHAPSTPDEDMVIIGLDDGENFNADVFDLVSLENVEYRNHIDNLPADNGDKFLDFTHRETLPTAESAYSNFDLNIQEIDGEEVDIYDDIGRISITNETDPKAFVASMKESDVGQLKGITLNTLEIPVRPNAKTKYENEYAALTIDVTEISTTVSNVTVPIRVEDYPQILAQYDEALGFYATTLSGDQLNVELSDWDAVGQTGVLWITIPEIDPASPPVILLSTSKPLTSNMVFAGDEYIYVLMENSYIRKYQPDGTLVWTSPNNYNNTYSLGIDEEGHIYACHYSVLYKLDKDDGSRIWQGSASISGYAYKYCSFGDYILIRTSNNSLYKYDKATGTRLWYFSIGSGDYNSMMVTPEGNLVLPKGNGDFDIYSIEDESLVESITFFKESSTISFQQGILTPEGKIIFGENTLHTFRVFDLKTPWIQEQQYAYMFDDNTAADARMMEPLSDGGFIAAFDNNNEVQRIDKYGRVVWYNRTIAGLINRLSIDKDENVYVAADDNKLHKILANGTYDWGIALVTDGQATVSLRLDEIPFGRYFHRAYETMRTPIWNSDYDAVFHMDQYPVGADSVKDATSNGNHATPTGMDSGNLVDSVLGKGLSFSGSGEFLTLAGLYAAEQAEGQIDIVFKTAANVGTLISQDADGWNNLDSIVGVGQNGVIAAGNGYPCFETHGPNTSESRGIVGGTLVNDGNIHVLSVKWDGTNYNMCLDGTFETPVATTEGFWGADGIVDILIGASGATGTDFSGEIAEIHIYNTAQSDDYIKVFHKSVLGTLFKTQIDLNKFDIGMDVALSFDNKNTFKVHNGTSWREILTKDAAVHGGADDGSWYIRNESAGDVTYETSGSWVSNPINCMIAFNIEETLINWTQVLPNNCTVSIKSKWEQSATVPTTPPATWDVVTKNAGIPNAPTTGDTHWLWLKIELSTTDSSASALVRNLQADITYVQETTSEEGGGVVIPVWDEELSSGNYILDNEGLDAELTVTGTNNTVIGNVVKSEGKWYWEITKLVGNSNYESLGVAYVGAGTDFDSTIRSGFNESWAGMLNNRLYHDGLYTAGGFTGIAVNDIMMFALDCETGKLYLGKNGTWFDSADPANGTNAQFIDANMAGTELTPVATLRYANDKISAAFSAADLTYTPPDGFNALDYTGAVLPNVQLNPDYKGSSIVIDETGLIITRSAGPDWEQVLADTGFFEGKLYFEVKATNTGNGYYDVVGIAQIGTDLEKHTGEYDTVNPASLGFMNNSRFYKSTVSGYLNASGGTWYNDNDIIMVAVDMDNGYIWFGVNGTWIGELGDSPDPATGTDPAMDFQAGTYYPAFSTYIQDVVMETIFAPDDFNYTPPTGFYAIGYVPNSNEYRLNPDDKSADLTLSNDDRTVAHTGAADGQDGIRAMTPRNTGKWYFEVHLDAITANSFTIGLSDASHSLNSRCGEDGSAIGVGYHTNTGRIYHDGTNFSSGLGILSADDYLCVAFDLNTGNVWFGINGVFSGDPAAGTGISYIEPEMIDIEMFPTITLYDNNNHIATYRYLEEHMEGNIPSGFKAYGDTSGEIADAGQFTAKDSAALAAEWNDNYSMTNLTVTDDTVVLGAGGDVGTRISNPIDLSPVFNLQSFELDYTIDEDRGDYFIPDYVSDVMEHLATGHPYSAMRDYSTSYRARYAFDRSTTFYETPANPTFPLYFGYAFKTPIAAEVFHIHFDSYALYGVTIEASNDGVNWKKIHGIGAEAPENEDLIITELSEGNQKESYYFYRIQATERASSYMRVETFQPMTRAFKVYGAVVESVTEPVTPPSSENFERLWPGELPFGWKVGDDLSGKWLWIKQEIDCTIAKPVLTNYSLSFNGTNVKRILFNSSDKWADNDSITDLEYNDGIGLAVASGAWNRASKSNLACCILESIQTSVLNRMSHRDIEDMDSADFIAGGYSSANGYLDIGMVMYNKGQYLFLENDAISINGSMYYFTRKIALPSKEVASFAKVYWQFLEDGIYDFDTIEVSSLVTGGDWESVATNGGQITDLEVAVDMSTKELQFRIKVPDGFPRVSFLNLLVQIR